VHKNGNVRAGTEKILHGIVRLSKSNRNLAHFAEMEPTIQGIRDGFKGYTWWSNLKAIISKGVAF